MADEVTRQLNTALPNLLTQLVQALGGNRANQREVTPSCNIKTFRASGAKEFFDTEGAVGLLTWFESTKSMLHITKCPAESQVEFAASMLQGRALTWWNTLKLESEFWNHKMVGSDIDGLLSETQQETVQNSNSSAQQDVLILSMFEQITNQVTHCNTVNKALTTELDRYKEEVKDLKEKQNVENSFSGSNEQFDEIVRLKQNLFEQMQEKDCLMKTVSELKNELKLEENRNIGREIALEKKIKQLDNIIFK
ncbi:hypothetical protein Tco_1559774, partial [Tanacetum coccineum]